MLINELYLSQGSQTYDLLTAYHKTLPANQLFLHQFEQDQSQLQLDFYSYEYMKPLYSIKKKRRERHPLTSKSNPFPKGFKPLGFQRSRRCNRITASTCLEEIKKMPSEAGGALAARSFS